ncbi:GNAT family N-acetyltransferase [Cryobacterium sp. SO1]|uniref:GNAT family N-acetyltransferase n=1 Tax=Cryobacterium sp. SO1 TaxID=1897061 RepID=UPI001022F22F|nr:GNAT family N-acetyltransferase [Cryobacterium sp. SO1]RZI34007.1 putative succinyl-CoA transferase [Cryobacterium sp. SO1]
MPADLWPLLHLRLTTSRLVLRYPTRDELAAMGGLAAAGVHHPGERPYLTPWTEGTPQQTAMHVVQQHWSRRSEWSSEAWALELGLFSDGQPVGMVALRGREFSTRREVKTESWLRAQTALTDVFRDNAGSQGVSRRLGYRHDGISRDVRDGQVLISDRLRLTRDDWFGTDRMRVDVTGLAPCLPWFGL